MLCGIKNVAEVFVLESELFNIILVTLFHNLTVLPYFPEVKSCLRPIVDNTPPLIEYLLMTTPEEPRPSGNGEKKFQLVLPSLIPLCRELLTMSV